GLLSNTPEEFETVLGGHGNDTIAGNDVDNYLAGNSGNDMITGNDGADTVTGNNDDDQLDGSGGDDLLLGGLGSDVMRGGDGNNKWVFEVVSDVENDVVDANDGTGINTLDFTAVPDNVTVNLSSDMNLASHTQTGTGFTRNVKTKAAGQAENLSTALM